MLKDVCGFNYFLVGKPFLRVLCFFKARVLRNLVRCRHTMLWARQASGLVQGAKFSTCLPFSQCATPWFVTFASTYSIWGGPTHLSTPLCSTGYFVALRIFGTLKRVTESVTYISSIVGNCDHSDPLCNIMQNLSLNFMGIWRTHTHIHTGLTWCQANEGL